LPVEQETTMAKGQKRSNRELKKPKAKKTVAGTGPVAPPTRAFLTPSGTGKKKA
jgi:hypothetical protein